MTDLIKANLCLLDQIVELLMRLDAESYVKPSPVFSNSAIGGHVRHFLEHYQSLIRGAPEGRVNYDQRARDPQIETQPATALARLGEVRAQLGDLPQAVQVEDVVVLMDHGADASDGVWQKSSLGRELQFLISHTVHHCALIAGLCHLHGVAVHSDFGVAPSTLRHRARLSSLSN
jgi:uncharacterized damage-inducible protein DinB